MLRDGLGLGLAMDSLGEETGVGEGMTGNGTPAAAGRAFFLAGVSAGSGFLTALPNRVSRRSKCSGDGGGGFDGGCFLLAFGFGGAWERDASRLAVGDEVDVAVACGGGDEGDSVDDDGSRDTSLTL